MHSNLEALCDSAQQSFSRREYQKSVEDWEKYLDSSPADNDQLYKASLAARYAKNFHLARKWLVTGCRKYPEDGRFRLDSAKLAMNQKHWSEAVVILENTPENLMSEDFFRFLAICYYRQGLPVLAAKTLEKGCKRYPLSPLLLLELVELRQECRQDLCFRDIEAILKAHSYGTLFNTLESLPWKETPKNLHLVPSGRFSFQFIRFFEKHFELDQHCFLMLDKTQGEHWPTVEHMTLFSSTFPSKEQQIADLAAYMRKADRIILHSLFNSIVLETLYQHPQFLRKCYWFLWGSDLYGNEEKDRSISNHKSKLIKTVIKNMAHLVCHNPKHLYYARREFDCQAAYINCFKYPSNMCIDKDAIPKVSFSFLDEKELTILMGNSASLLNCHDEIFTLLSPFINEDFQVICPLNYGDKEYAHQVARKGKLLLGDKFYPLMEDMDYERYCALLSKIDLAVLYHHRDQGMGTIRQLLAMGKKVYVNSEHGALELMTGLGVKMFELKEFELEPDFEQRQSNIEKMNHHYSRDALLKGLGNLFEQAYR
ncbi:TDP-N-acetylfucosamine:lipid II N-acetylfucosaminyltransferase [Lacimicrobium sp. SS2-24]|uniref:TDP-N-acetylfucosamine:lipid II N-acetylfucosaminyltransferase n=1 Tax=Lacimicrobium sp. SS2-24 TaxID=2005569 RepID=UPI000B4B2C57|nr:TDP-N-acetylfucosamine:lipid II N-acetylfucosaminyltransferase [Lacimicrobium sp. SS2-24]